jgi:hypothetical protein
MNCSYCRCWIFSGLILLSSVSCRHESPEVERNGILIDAVHANDCSGIGLEPKNYNYHEINGFRFGFDHLKSRGIRCDTIHEGRLDEKTLAGYQMLFINLVSAERPPFLVPEILAVVNFVKSGGTLFVITDHSNCYFHAYRLEPLFTELEIESPTDMICERPPYTLSSGNGWLFADRFITHPVTEGLRHIAIQTGGRVDSRFAAVLTSENSWADAWENPLFGEGKSMGFYGDYVQKENEPHGPFGIVLVKEFGKGRIIAVSDQNIFGDPFINYADNYRLWLNIMSWGLHNPSIAGPAACPQQKTGRIWFVEPFTQPMFGRDEERGMYNFWCLLNRHFRCFANDRLEGSPELAILPNGFVPLEKETLEDLVKHLRQGKKLLILQNDSRILSVPESIVSRIFTELEIKDCPVTVQNGLERMELPDNGGTVFFFGTDKILDNSGVPEPTVSPIPAYQKFLEENVEIIRQIMKE